MMARMFGNQSIFAVVAAMIILGGVSSTSVSADPSDDLVKSCVAVAKTDCSKWAAAGGGGGLPRGLTSGTMAELAPGERYVLSGTISIAQNEVYLKIDLSEHPWLASSRRKSQPYYHISDSVNRWKKYNYKAVTAIFRADAVIWALGADRYTYEIALTPIEGTVIVEGFRY